MIIGFLLVAKVYLHVDAGLYAGVKASVEASYGLTAAADASLTLTATYRDSTGKVERSLNFNWDQLDTKATPSTERPQQCCT